MVSCFFLKQFFQFTKRVPVWLPGTDILLTGGNQGVLWSTAFELLFLFLSPRWQWSDFWRWRPNPFLRPFRTRAPMGRGGHEMAAPGSVLSRTLRWNLALVLPATCCSWAVEDPRREWASRPTPLPFRWVRFTRSYITSLATAWLRVLAQGPVCAQQDQHLSVLPGWQTPKRNNQPLGLGMWYARCRSWQPTLQSVPGRRRVHGEISQPAAPSHTGLPAWLGPEVPPASRATGLVSGMSFRNAASPHRGRRASALWSPGVRWRGDARAACSRLVSSSTTVPVTSPAIPKSCLWSAGPPSQQRSGPALSILSICLYEEPALLAERERGGGGNCPSDREVPFISDPFWPCHQNAHECSGLSQRKKVPESVLFLKIWSVHFLLALFLLCQDFEPALSPSKGAWLC